MEITPDTRPVRHDLSIVQMVLPDKVLLSPDAHRVRTGTPLIAEHGAWRPTRDGENPWMFACTPGEPGERIDVCKSMIVETHVQNLIPGPVAIVDVDNTGRVTFVNDPNGRYLATTRSRVLLG